MRRARWPHRTQGMHMDDTGTPGALGELARFQACATECLECARSCTEIVAVALDAGGAVNVGALVPPLLDTSDVCHANAALLTRGAVLHADSCALCAAACANSAEACMIAAGRLEGRSPLAASLTACASACRRCAAACLYFVGLK